MGRTETVTGRVHVETSGAASLDRLAHQFGNVTNTTGIAKMAAAWTAAALVVNQINQGLQTAVRYASDFSKEVVSASSQFENYSLAFQTMLGSASAASERMEALLQFAKETPFQLNEVVNAGKLLEGLGLYDEQRLRLIGDTASGMNRSLEDTVKAIAGVYQGETEAIKTYGVNARMIAKKLGHEINRDTVEGLEEAGRAVEEIFAERFGGGMQLAGKSVSTTLSNLEDAFFRFKLKVGGMGLFDEVSVALRSALSIANEIVDSDVAENLSRTLTAAFHDVEIEILFGKTLIVDTIIGKGLIGQEGRPQGIMETVLLETPVGGILGKIFPHVQDTLDDYGTIQTKGLVETLQKISDEGGFPKGMAKEWALSLEGVAKDGQIGLDAWLDSLWEFVQGAKESQRAYIEAARAGPPITPGWSPFDKPVKPGPIGALGLEEITLARERERGLTTTRTGWMGEIDQSTPEEIADPWLSANELILESYERLSDSAIAIYEGMHGTIRGLTDVTSQIVESALLKEDLSRLKGLTVVKYVAAAGGAAILRTISKVAETRAIEATAQGFLALGFIPGPQGAVASFKSAALYGLIAGVTSGIAGAMETGAQRDFQRQIEQRPYQEPGGTGSGATQVAEEASPSAQVVAAGAAPTTVNYNFTQIFNGPVLYGEGGTRDWFYRDLVPLINEAIGARQIQGVS